MTEEKTIRVEGKTFVWDGETYPSEDDANATEADYRAQGFDVQRRLKQGSVLLYSRRPVSSSDG